MQQCLCKTAQKQNIDFKGARNFGEKKRMVTVENVTDEMENGNLPNAVMENIESKIDERLKAANENMNQSVKNVVIESVNAATKSVSKRE